MRDEKELFTGLPGEELIVQGLEDLRQGEVTAEALLAELIAPCLRHAGIEVPSIKVPNVEVPGIEVLGTPSVETSVNDEDYVEMRLYRLLCETDGADAYSRYNSLKRRAARFQRALEQRITNHA